MSRYNWRERDAKRLEQAEADDLARAAEHRRRRDDPTDREQLLDSLEEATSWEECRDALVYALNMGGLS